MKDSITVLRAGDAKKVLPYLTYRPFTWLYLGQDIRQRESTSQLLGRGHRYFLGDLLQEVAYREKQPFLDFIAELGSHQKNKLRWWASNIAYKSPLTSNFFLLWCYATVFSKICSEERWGSDKLLLVLVEDCWLYRHLWSLHKEETSKFSFPSRKSIVPELLKSIARGIAVRVYLLFSMGPQLLPTRGNPSKGSKSEIYIHSWVRDRFFTEDGKLENPYLGRLPQLIINAGHSITYVPELLLTSALKKKCLSQKEFKLIFLDQYTTPWSLIRSVLSFLSIPSLPFSPTKTLLLREVAYEFAHCAFPTNILLYTAFKAFLKEVGQERITIIYLFENQPWEKMLCLATKEANRNIKLVGYQHSSIPLLLLNYFLGSGESSTIPLPHVIITDGEYTLKLLKEEGYRGVELVNGGALRYEYLHQRSSLPTQKRLLKTILVTLPYSRSLTEEMLLAVFSNFKDPVDRQTKLAIKFHPEVPLTSLKIKLPTWPVHFQKVDKPLSEFSKEVDLVIYSSSTIGLEGLLGGIPVVQYRSEHSIELEPLGTTEEKIRSCSESSMRQVVLSALDGSDNYPNQGGAPSLNNFFSPVDEDVWKGVIGSKEEG